MEQKPKVPLRREARRKIQRFRWVGVVACTIIALVGCLVGMLFFARPESSAMERRQLTDRPELTAESFFDGTYFSELSLWYADTYPLRESMVSASQTVKKLYGVSGNTAVVNANVQADEVPVEPDSNKESEPEEVPLEVVDGETAEQTEESSEPVERIETIIGDKPEIDYEIPWGRDIDAAVQDSIMNGLYIKDGAAYSICYFSQSGADMYIAAANELARQLDGTAQVFSLLVPASAIVLPQEEYESVGGSDQRQVLDYVWSRFDDGVTQVDVLDTMLAHADEYPYFRTDHHWTMRGAYNGYVEYCKVKGLKPADLDEFEYRDMGDFAGSYYDTILMYGDAAIDDFETFTPKATNNMVRRSPDWEEVDDLIVQDSSDWDIYGKYDSLSGCDPASGTIHNPQIHDGSACLVVKDSYGSAFIPFLIANYEYVHMIDTRIFAGSICDYVRDNGIQDVILCYGIKVGLEDESAYLLYSCI